MKLSPPRLAFALLAGFAIWSVAFVLFYGGHGLICATGLPAWLGPRVALIAALVLSLAAQAVLIVWLARGLRAPASGSPRLEWIALALSLAALGATVWLATPILVLEPC